MRTVHQVSRLLAAAFLLATASSAFAADDGVWTVSKSSGEVWLTNGTGAQRSIAETGRTPEARRHHPHQAHRSSPAAAQRGRHDALTEFG